MLKQLLLSSGALVVFMTACHTHKKTVTVDTEEWDLDTMMIIADKPETEITELAPYQASAKRDIDIVHTSLDVRFDWTKEQVIGKAKIKMTPIFYPTSLVVLDAKGFKFNSIKDSKGKELQYTYDNSKVQITMGRTYTRKDTFELTIDYVATPRGEGGSSAINSDKGLFFINADGSDVNKPQQIWTQGETESNSRWFPTVDKPNERCTQEMFITTEDRFVTLSNGIKVKSTPNGDGTHTDHWVMDKPHAPYLFMIAIGDFSIIQDKWRGIDVDYYMEPKYKDYARDIFPYTPEMLDFFSNTLGVNYPWPKYAQVVVRDYVSGAMENTSAVIFGEFINGTDRELAGSQTNELIVAHEMFHHWFGDLVTCESWSNLTLNEGFANYSEYLWLEHQHGKEVADAHRVEELGGYLNSSRNGIHDLIWFDYDDKESMFDAHSYNKGGLILHMLRNYVGDEAFFASLKSYLNKHAYSDVEGHELRMAFEDVTGMDLNWFFNQWFYDKGQPNLVINYDYDEENKEIAVSVSQTQDPAQMPAIFRLPASIDVYMADGSKERVQVEMTKREQVFSIPSKVKPALVNFDGDKVLLATREENKTIEEYAFQYLHAPTFVDRSEALSFVGEMYDATHRSLFLKALKDPSPDIRMQVLEYADVSDSDFVKETCKALLKDKDARVRASAFDFIGGTEDPLYAPLAEAAITNDKADMVVSSALLALVQLDEAKAIATASKLEKSSSLLLIQAVGDLYERSGDISHLPFFEEHWDSFTSYDVIGFLGAYANLASTGNEDNIKMALGKLRSMALNTESANWNRFGALRGINEIHIRLVERLTEKDKTVSSALDAEVIKVIEEIKAWEKDENLSMFYKGFPNPPAK